jgi:uncharacterized membrane protein YfcA
MITNTLSIYFPVAELHLSALIVLGIGFVSGIMSGLLGIGGGFISTPLLTAVGVPPSVAVATSAHQIVGASFSSILPRLKARKIDFKLGITLAASGVVGSYIGMLIFEKFAGIGNIDSLIGVFYIILMTTVSFLSFKSYFSKSHSRPKIKSPRFTIFKTHFPISGVECSILIPIMLGTFTGILVVIMGVGGGFILVPAMVSIMKVKNDVAVGTSLLQIFLITIIVLIFHVFKTGLLDIMLGVFLIIGATIGAQISSIISLKIGKRKIINLLLAILTLGVACKFGVDLFFSSKEQKILIEELHEQGDNYKWK